MTLKKYVDWVKYGIVEARMDNAGFPMHLPRLFQNIGPLAGGQYF